MNKAITDEYAISNWPDTKELLEKLRVLANEMPLYQIERGQMKKYLDEFEKNPRVQDFGNLLTVGDLCSYVGSKLE